MDSGTLQWLAEIRALQNQVMALQQDRDEMAATAQRWQKLYETEAHQRRSEATTAQATIAQLQAELAAQASRHGDGIAGGEGWAGGGASPCLGELQDRCDRVQTLAEAQAELRTLLLVCADLQQQVIQLGQTLAAEQAAHQQTRKTLTMALGDTIDLLTQERQKQSSPLPPRPDTPIPASA